ncbi:hypothetical protein Gotri_027474 [Gossypium trilobum]|uniref:Cyclin-dependent kinase inhibitor domain-containing protein n=1 Tax=Gossypium trilobum TaxID=34281 RepID=A0A7J9FRU0_9ROSI|nr:hypothetical protein [Gossypium trilobum]
MELADVGVQTRGVATTGRVQKKRRRLNDGNKEEECRKVTSSTTSTTSYIQLRSRTILADRHRRDGNRCLSLNSDHDDDVSCCSSNIESSDKRIMELPDLEDESIEVETSTHFSSSERSTVEKMPTEAELEEFFAPAEKKLQKQFADKYNYDIVKDEPLEGRYEWIRLKP